MRGEGARTEAERRANREESQLWSGIWTHARFYVCVCVCVCVCIFGGGHRVRCASERERARVRDGCPRARGGAEGFAAEAAVSRAGAEMGFGRRVCAGLARRRQ